jgi:hypothetical protein
MLWAYLFAATLGVIFGLRLKVPAVAASSAVIVIGGTLAAAVSGWTIGWAVLVAMGASSVFQCGYLLGLGLTCMADRHWAHSVSATRPTLPMRS